MAHRMDTCCRPRECNRYKPPNVPDLIAMERYSRVAGKVWEALYEATTSESTRVLFRNEYLELFIIQSQEDIQPGFIHDLNDPIRF